MPDLVGNPAVGDIVVTTTEQEIRFPRSHTLIIYPDAEVLISIETNTNYKKYPAYQAIPITSDDGITRIYAKVSVGTANLGIWAMRR